MALRVHLEGVGDVGAIAAQNGLVDARHQDVACKDLTALVLVGELLTQLGPALALTVYLLQAPVDSFRGIKSSHVVPGQLQVFLGLALPQGHAPLVGDGVGGRSPAARCTRSQHLVAEASTGDLDGASPAQLLSLAHSIGIVLMKAWETDISRNRRPVIGKVVTRSHGIPRTQHPTHRHPTTLTHVQTPRHSISCLPRHQLTIALTAASPHPPLRCRHRLSCGDPLQNGLLAETGALLSG